MTATLPDTTQAFLNAIRANLADNAPRLIYADWLDENGQGDRAEFIRLQIAIHHLGINSGHPKTTPLAWSCKCDVCEEAKPLRRRERELLLNWPKWFSIKTNCVRVCENPIEGSDPSLINGGLRFKFSRGFIGRVSAPLGVLCGERCERCNGTGSVYPPVNSSGWLLQIMDCPACKGAKRTPGVLRDIVRSEVAAVEYVEASDVQPWRNAHGEWVVGPGNGGDPAIPQQIWEAFNEDGPYRTEAAARAALSRAMLEAV